MLVQLGDIKNIKKQKYKGIGMTWIIKQIALPCLLHLSDTKCAKVMRRNTVLKATLLVILVHFLALYFHNLQFCPELIPIIIIFISRLSSDKRI